MLCGKYEACTAFAIILKFVKMSPDTVTHYLQEAMDIKAVPEYYAKQLMGKINQSDKASAHHTPSCPDITFFYIFHNAFEPLGY